ncbi:MAG: phosphoglucosamine mutase [Candidatus Micrarchaeia archaeon]
MFGTSGIRGIYGRDITESLAGRVSSVFSQDRMVIGRDIRESGPSLFDAASMGAMRAGCDVISLGIVPTPTVALATKKHGCRGIMLTASHNPPQYNGLKLMQDGKEIGKGMEREVTEAYNAWSGPRSRGDGRSGGSLFHDTGIVGDHKDLIVDIVDAGIIGRKRPKVIVDCNGAASAITPYMLSDLGCQVVSLNASEYCFNRPSEPKEDSLPYLGELVRRSRADFAIAHDGDGDRCIIFDDQGSALPFDVQLAMMIGHELDRAGKNRRVVSTVEASLTIRDVVEGKGGKIEITPVGSTFVGDEMERSGALFGGEPCGEYIYGAGVHVPDAVLAAAKFAEMFCAGGKLSRAREGYARNFMARERFPVSDKLKAIGLIKGMVEIEGKVRSDDGIRVDEEDGWFLIRASGTEPIIRLTMEYKRGEKLEERKAALVALIRKAISRTQA